MEVFALLLSAPTVAMKESVAMDGDVVRELESVRRERSVSKKPSLRG
jgi:hypothetical protein